MGITGLGRSGVRHHLNTLLRLNDRYEVTRVYDSDQAHMQQVANSCEIQPCQSFEQLIHAPDVEIVVLATPSWLHGEQSLAAMAAGKEVICEKPMALSLEEATEVVNDSIRRNRMYSVFHNSRYGGDYQIVRKVLESGVLGRIVEIRMCWNTFNRREDWQSLRKYGGGILHNIGPHPIDLALQLLGTNTPQVQSYSDSVFSPDGGIDHAFITLCGEHEKVPLYLELSNVDAMLSPRWHILGTDGGLSGSGIHLKWKYTEPLEQYLTNRLTDFERSDKIQRGVKSWQEQEWRETEDDRSLKYYQDFYHTYTAHGRASVDPEQALSVMKVIDQVEKQFLAGNRTHSFRLGERQRSSLPV